MERPPILKLLQQRLQLLLLHSDLFVPIAQLHLGLVREAHFLDFGQLFLSDVEGIITFEDGLFVDGLVEGCALVSVGVVVFLGRYFSGCFYVLMDFGLHMVITLWTGSDVLLHLSTSPHFNDGFVH